MLLLIGVTAVWGYTFVPVQDAIATYPIFAFLAVRFAVSTVVLAPFALRAAARMPRSGMAGSVAAGLVLALGYALQTAGLDLTTVASSGFITGLYVVVTPVLALAFFRTPVPARVWAGVALSLAGLLLLNGVPGGSAAGNLLVLGAAVAMAAQIVMMERLAPRHDIRALTFLQMAVCAVAFGAIALADGFPAPTGGRLWWALIATGVFAGALGYLVAFWVQARTTAARAAVVFTLEAPFAALFGVLLAGERLGAAGWAGCAVTLAAILVSEAGAVRVLRRHAQAAS